MVSSNKSNLLLVSLSGLLTTAIVNAQNASCPNSQQFEIVNSTGQYEFTWNSSYASDDPWYVSVLVGRRGREWNDRSDVKANAYISAPENVSNGTSICTYQYSNINATLESGGENSCSGVISSGCMDHLTKALSAPTSLCPDSDTGSSSEAFNQACPMLTGGSRNSKFVDVTNGTCSYDMPELHVPDKYNTFITPVGVEMSNAVVKYPDANTTYDFLTRQTIPLVILGRLPDSKSNMADIRTEFVCMTANETVQGSRVPEDNTPWESAGSDLSARMVGWAAGVVMVGMLVL